MVYPGQPAELTVIQSGVIHFGAFADGHTVFDADGVPKLDFWAVCALVTVAGFVVGIVLSIVGGVQVLIPETGTEGLDRRRPGRR